MQHRLALITVACTLALSACGGGGGGAPSDSSINTTTPAPTVASSVSGVAATGKPLAGATVTAYGSDGKACGSAQTAGDGSYAMNTQCAAGPVVFAVTAGAPSAPPLGAIGLSNVGSGAVGGTVNLTPLSTLALYDFVATQTIVPTAQAEPDFAHVLAAVPAIWQAAPLVGQGAQAFGSQVLAAARAVVQAVAAQLQAAGVNPASFDPVATSFAANGQGVDAVFDQFPASAPAANAYQLGSLLSLQLPVQPGSMPVFGGSAGAALAASGGATTPTVPVGGSTVGGNLRFAMSSFTGALAGSTCSVTTNAGQASGTCTLNGQTYPIYGTLAVSAYGPAILNIHPQNMPNVLILAILLSSSGVGTGQGSWVDPLGQIVPGGGSGNLTFQASAA